MGIKVLLIEDHTMTRMGLQVVLGKSEEIELVGEAEDGISGVKQAQECLPDLILMDIGLPEIDGIEATRRIKALNLPSKILMFTSRDSEADVFEALSAGADGYIMKGANPEQMIAAIKAVFDGNAWLDQAIAKMVLGAVSRPVIANSTPEITSNETAKFIKSVGLTERELEVLKLIVEGLTNPQIADRLFIAKATAKAHVHSILQKLCVGNRNQATVTAMKEKIV